jgi:MbtH protein
MYEDDDIDTRNYNVVINHEEQYSIWFTERGLPLGWTIVSVPEQWQTDYQKEHPIVDKNAGNKDVCLAYINEVWVDMRPLSLRKELEKISKTA